jgi:hypothetical protein
MKGMRRLGSESSASYWPADGTSLSEECVPDGERNEELGRGIIVKP